MGAIKSDAGARLALRGHGQARQALHSVCSVNTAQFVGITFNCTRSYIT